ncbi:MAG: dihydrodipicolinate synthase family protein [Phycisphaerae bacterium]|nr:dihydrodipicolinate synthase family protein [Phycisphaerae bacterium]NIU11041.1 dihydrodipicolinate synthase family protein [Phycisphaerae bacterium]NIU58356.1 dihydrodipicolinate synthase family protein [Phycisphaerae bacterium]NIW95231.1 dihydrodipicolinate synthase family protein [Phycisphaerae bacterium]
MESSSNVLPRPIRGIIPPMVTPLLDRDSLDVAGLEKLIEHILAGGVQGLFILGTTGEAPSLSQRLRRELIERVCVRVKGRVPVLVGITDTCFVESVNIACKAKDAGAQAVVLAPPYYFPAGQGELLEYLEHLMPELPLPLVLYNMPSYTKLVFEPDTVKAAAAITGIVGIKESSGDMVYFNKLLSLLKKRPDFSLLMGHEELLAEAVLAGAHGGVCGGANLVPKLYVDLYNAAYSKDMPTVESLQKKVMQISEAIYGVGKYESSYLKGLKCALSCMGICSDFMAEPFHRFRRAERKVIRRHIEELGIMQNE